MEMGDADKPLPEDQYPLTYFALADHRGVIFGHIVLMVLAWVFALPAGKAPCSSVMLTGWFGGLIMF